MSRGYVRADAAHTAGPWQTDAGTPGPDDTRKRRLEEYDVENEIPQDWEGAWE